MFPENQILLLASEDLITRSGLAICRFSFPSFSHRSFVYDVMQKTSLSALATGCAIERLTRLG
jgi:hypothetical protein